MSSCCFPDKYFDIIRTERGVSAKKDIGDDSDRIILRGTYRPEKLELNTLWTIYLQAFHALVLRELQAPRIQSYQPENEVVRRRSVDVLR